MNIYFKYKGFTLAEVLITLTIIGVIAAITIPNLMQKWKDQADVAKVKSAYSLISNALKLAVAENGPMDSWDWPVLTATSGHFHDNRLYMAEMMKKYFKVAKFCGIENGKGACSYYAYNTEGTGSGQFFQGTSGTTYNHGLQRLDYLGRMQLANGMLIGFAVENIRVDKFIVVDINGDKKPNRAGYDYFEFPFELNGKVIPGYYTNHKGNYCNGVTAGNRDGTSCAEWVIKHGNMDYKYLDAATVNARW